jgi:hypothetical protein
MEYKARTGRLEIKDIAAEFRIQIRSTDSKHVSSGNTRVSPVANSYTVPGIARLLLFQTALFLYIIFYWEGLYLYSIKLYLIL